ncbi:DUF4912 domain-containing protein [Candidatus Omnitrophota bacterium]
MPEELPFGYNVDKLVLQVRDPWWLHSYWELSDATFQSVTRQLGNSSGSVEVVLRVYDVTHINFNGTKLSRTNSGDASGSNGLFIN